MANGMANEMNFISHNQTWQLTKLPIGKRPVIVKQIFKVNNDSTCKSSKYRLGWLLKDLNRRKLIFSKKIIPVIKWSTIRNVIVLVAHFGWKISQMDVKTTFLNVDIKEDTKVS
jgi:hypothetical protein